MERTWTWPSSGRSGVMSSDSIYGCSSLRIESESRDELRETRQEARYAGGNVDGVHIVDLEIMVEIMVEIIIVGEHRPRQSYSPRTYAVTHSSYTRIRIMFEQATLTALGGYTCHLTPVVARVRGLRRRHSSVLSS